jgi:hypothetical protein
MSLGTRGGINFSVRLGTIRHDWVRSNSAEASCWRHRDPAPQRSSWEMGSACAPARPTRRPPRADPKEPGRVCLSANAAKEMFPARAPKTACGGARAPHFPSANVSVRPSRSKSRPFPTYPDCQRPPALPYGLPSTGYVAPLRSLPPPRREGMILGRPTAAVGLRRRPFNDLEMINSHGVNSTFCPQTDQANPTLAFLHFCL